MKRSQQVAGFLFLLLVAATQSGCIAYVPMGAWGRPLRIAGKTVQPRIRVSDEWAAGAVPDTTGLSVATREALAEWWLLDAQKEHASIPAFARLAWQLTALGAPASLLERTYRAGLQEIRHARRCFALVSAYRGEPVGVMPMPELANAGADLDLAIDLATLATESLLDGCLIEGVNADAARLALTRATDPAVRELLRIITVDETCHAELAWAIVEWCLATGGDEVAAALDHAMTTTPTVAAGLYSDELAAKVDRCALADLHAHGRVPTTDWPALLAARLAATRTRLAEVLSPGDRG